MYRIRFVLYIDLAGVEISIIVHRIFCPAAMPLGGSGSPVAAMNGSKTSWGAVKPRSCAQLTDLVRAYEWFIQQTQTALQRLTQVIDLGGAAF